MASHRPFIARSSHVHRTFIARTFTCKVLVNNVRVSCSAHALFLRKVKNNIKPRKLRLYSLLPTIFTENYNR